MIPQLLDDPLALREIMPMLAGVAEVQFLFAVSENFAQTRVVKQQATIFVPGVPQDRTPVFHEIGARARPPPPLEGDHH